MQYVLLADWRPSTDNDQEKNARALRSKWTYPEGVRPILELWPASGSPAVIVAFEADDTGSVDAVRNAWEEYFHIRISPAITSEEGLQLEPEELARWHLQPFI
ncbi:DUF3303 domain-containing protein [Arthrobacter sp. ISL-65]|uniref:DUF3303 domain-containing protein n=1 Tax=Arthrobacter sp. ISL-65 TaxID=2819112 RepID=UPI001BE6E8AE|nr:DUF3303 family protein [Arthrobacter sp. ISL-65]MBT2547467.1 DUF3303 family protein [Arthrobacter sp. ISL-65]